MHVCAGQLSTVGKGIAELLILDLHLKGKRVTWPIQFERLHAGLGSEARSAIDWFQRSKAMVMCRTDGAVVCLLTNCLGNIRS